MGEDPVVFYDDTRNLEESQRNILRHRSVQEEAPTYLVELAEKRTDAQRPLNLPRSRPRRSTIVDTWQLPDREAAEEQPLEEYVRRNLPSFRRSIAPQDLQQLTTSTPAQDRNRGEEVVSPATAEDIERDLMDRKKQKERGTENLYGYERRPEETAQVHRVTYEFDYSPGQHPRNHKDSKKPDDSTVEKNKPKRFSPNKSEYSLPRNEVVVMAALEPVSAAQKSPFTKEQKSTPQNKYPLPPLKVGVFIESSDEDSYEDDKYKRKPRSKKGKKDSSSAKRKEPNEPNWGSFEEDSDRAKKKRKKRENSLKSEHSTKSLDQVEEENENHHRIRSGKDKSEQETRARKGSRDSSRRLSRDHKPRRKSSGKVSRSRSSSVCLSGGSGGNSSEPNIVYRYPKKEKRPKPESVEKGRTPSVNDRTASAKSSGRDKKGSLRSSTRKSDGFVEYKKTTNPFGKEEPYSVHYVATGNQPDAGGSQKRAKKEDGDSKTNKKDKDSKTNKKDKDNKEKRGGEAPKNADSAKPPKPGTKMVAKRRYHIQIPEHGRPETWFNVRFNMNSRNSVEMDYEGPVKINNYYASNNYN